MWGPGPLWEGGSVVAECSVVDLVNEDAQQSGCLVVRVGLELRVDLDDERRSYGGKQSSLICWSTGVSEKPLRLTKIRVVFKSSSYFLRKSLSYSSATLRYSL